MWNLISSFDVKEKFYVTLGIINNVTTLLRVCVFVCGLLKKKGSNFWWFYFEDNPDLIKFYYNKQKLKFFKRSIHNFN